MRRNDPRRFPSLSRRALRLSRPQRRLAASFLALLVAAGMLLPFLWLVLVSFSNRSSFGLQVPSLTVSNYSKVLSPSSGFGFDPFLSSFYLGLGSAILSTVIGFPAAYALSRGRLRHKRGIMLGALFLSALPLPALVVPIYELYTTLGLLNSLVFTGGVIGVTALPFTVWILTSQMDSIPVELDEAAGIDGAGTARVLLRIILPVVAPGVSFAFIFSFLQGWGGFLIPLILDTIPSETPAPIAVYNFMSDHTGFAFGAIGAFSVLFCIPVVALYSLVSKQFSTGFSAAGALAG